MLPVTPVEEWMSLSAGLIIGERYELLRELAHGAMGTVWVASEDKKRNVAIKFIHPDNCHEGALERFDVEIRTIAGLSGPNVVRIFTWGKHEGTTPYMVMELLEGKDLAGVLEAGPIASIESA